MCHFWGRMPEALIGQDMKSVNGSNNVTGKLAVWWTRGFEYIGRFFFLVFSLLLFFTLLFWHREFEMCKFVS
jgi:hypothetical protein